MGFASRLLIPGRVSRVATLGVLAGGVALTVWFTINRNVGENTTRMLRDKDGTWRWMTRSDWIQDRLQVSAVATAVTLEAGVGRRWAVQHLTLFAIARHPHAARRGTSP